MRSLVLVLALVTVAHADKAKAPPKDESADKVIDKLVRRNVKAASRDGTDFGVTKSAVIWLTLGTTPTIDDTQTLGDNFYADLQASVRHDVDKVIVSVDTARGLAWFQAPYHITMSGGMDDKTYKSQARVSGVAIQDGGAWKIAAIAYGELISDKELTTGEPRFASTDAVKGGPKTTGDAALAKAVASWFDGGFAAQVAANATPIAGGSSPAASEMQSGAGTAKLVKSWDALKLQARAIDAKLLPGGKVGFVKVDVAMPVKKTTKTAPLLLYVVAVKDGSDWKWVSLQYASGMGP